MAPSQDSLKKEIVKELVEDETDFEETECVSLNLENCNQNNFPFSIADKVVIHSFDMHIGNGNGLSSINNGVFELNGINESKELTKTERNELYSVLYGTKSKRKGNTSTAMECYNPHHTIVFFSIGIPIEFIEICIECESYRTHKKTSVDFCDEKWCTFYDYFQSIGLKKTSTYLTRKCGM